MNKGMLKWGYVAGLFAPIWLLIGVVIAGSLYPGYSHFNQAMSELGAIGAPTHVLSPQINNFPLGVLLSSSVWPRSQLSKPRNSLD